MERLAIRWWQWPTVLSLDAPLVAVLWQDVLARGAGVALGAAPRFVLGASVWLSYVGDRWFEGWRVSPQNLLTPRHWIYRRWRWPVMAIGSLMIAADVAVARLGLSRLDFDAGLMLLGAVLAYLLSHQAMHRRVAWRLPKELCVGLLFGAGAALFILPGRPGALGAIAAPLACFAGLCFANCALISVWERDLDLRRGETSLSRQFARGEPLSRALPWVLLVVSAAAAAGLGPSQRPALACAAAASALLGAVDRLESRLGRQAARVLADLVLMTPIVPLVQAMAARPA